jgi:putative endopeptidase
VPGWSPFEHESREEAASPAAVPRRRRHIGRLRQEGRNRQDGRRRGSGGHRAHARREQAAAGEPLRRGDLDVSKDACTDFGGYANGKWLAANAIPGDRTSWGAFEMLDERSQAVQRQLAEQAAAKADATGVEKIVGDFYATGMDASQDQRAGHRSRSRGRLDAIACARHAGQDRRVPARPAQPRARTCCSRSVLRPTSKDSTMNIATPARVAWACRTRAYYFDADKKKSWRRTKPTSAKVLGAVGRSRRDAAKQAKDVIAFETRLARRPSRARNSRASVELYYNPVSPADADKLTPNFPWTKFMASQGVACRRCSRCRSRPSMPK